MCSVAVKLFQLQWTLLGICKTLSKFIGVYVNLWVLTLINALICLLHVTSLLSVSVCVKEVVCSKVVNLPLVFSSDG